MGHIFDSAKIQASGGEDAFKNLTGDGLNQVLAVAAQTSFRYVAILPAILLVVFGAIWIYDKAKGGYKPVKLGVPAVGKNPLIWDRSRRDPIASRELGVANSLISSQPDNLCSVWSSIRLQ